MAAIHARVRRLQVYFLYHDDGDVDSLCRRLASLIHGGDRFGYRSSFVIFAWIVDLVVKVQLRLEPGCRVG